MNGGGYAEHKENFLIAIMLMAGLSFSNLLGLKIAGLAVVVGVVFSLSIRARKQPLKAADLILVLYE